MRFIFYIYSRRRREQQGGGTLKTVSQLNTASESPVRIYGLRIENPNPATVEYSEKGVPTLLVNRNETIRIFGSGWTDNSVFILTDRKASRGEHCEYLTGDILNVRKIVLYSVDCLT